MGKYVLRSSKVKRTEHLLGKITQIIGVTVAALIFTGWADNELWIIIPCGLLISFMLYQLLCIIRLKETSIQHVDGKVIIKAFKGIYSPKLVTETLEAADVKSKSEKKHLLIRGGYEHLTITYNLVSGETKSFCIDTLQNKSKIKEEDLTKSRKRHIIYLSVFLFLAIISMVIPVLVNKPATRYTDLYFILLVLIWAFSSSFLCDYPENLEAAGEDKKAMKILLSSFGLAVILTMVLIITLRVAGWLA